MAISSHIVSAAVGADNDASIAIVKRLGMQYEGRIRDHVFTNGDWRDSLLHSLLASEWETISATSGSRGGAATSPPDS
jgi:RimJ/RimL family protein N-acetyltransferase